MSPAVNNVSLYSYQDYLKLPSDKKFEIIYGILYAMTPSPTIEHQRVLGNMYLEIAGHLKDKTCEVLMAPCDVLLPEQNEEIKDTKTIVQPDIFVVCDKSKLAKKYCIGAPDWIIEVASPSMPSIDYVKKLHLYERHKVEEYWIVNYLSKEVMVYKLEKDGYGAPMIFKGGTLTPNLFSSLKLDLMQIFC